MRETPMTELPPPAPDEAGPLSHPAARTHYLRARGLLLAPTAEWGVIAEEKPSTRQLFLYWVLPLTVFFFLAQQLGSIAFPQMIRGVAAAPSVVRALYTVLVGTAFTCGGVWMLAWAIDYFAPTFGGKRDPAQAMKLAAYSGTGLWVLGGVFGLAPPIAMLGALGIVSFYTLYRGLPVLMRAPEDQTLPYAASVIAVAAVIGVVLMTLSACMANVGGGSALSERRPVKAEAPVIAAPAKVAPFDPAAPLDPDKMRRLIPDAIPGGWVRSDITRNAGGVMGFTGPTVEGVFENGGQRIRIQVVDLGQNRAAAAIASLRATRPAYESEKGSIRHTDAPYTYEEVDRVTGATRWLTVVGDRVVVAAEGAGGVSVPDLKTAVGLIDMVRVDQIAKGL